MSRDLFLGDLLIWFYWLEDNITSVASAHIASCPRVSSRRLGTASEGAFRKLFLGEVLNALDCQKCQQLALIAVCNEKQGGLAFRHMLRPTTAVLNLKSGSISWVILRERVLIACSLPHFFDLHSEKSSCDTQPPWPRVAPFFPHNGLFVQNGNQ